MGLESPLRRAIRNARLAGVVAVLAVLAVTGVIACLLVQGASLWNPIAGDAVSILLLYTCFAGCDLARHSRRVYKALAGGDLDAARHKLSMLVGRDTDRLDEPEVVRGAIESVAENMVDGVTAPLFFAILAGPVGAMLYKAVNTLDSTFGYKDERYIHFGWASARLDDVVNYIPARLTAPLIALSAAILGLRPLEALRILLRDGRLHESPNSGLSEAAVAGAMGVQLGGVNYYAGERSEHPLMGDLGQPLQRVHILRTNRLMLLTSCLALAAFAGIRLFLLRG